MNFLRSPCVYSFAQILFLVQSFYKGDNSFEKFFVNRLFLIFALATFEFVSYGCARDVANRYYGAEKYPPKKPSDVLLLYSRPSGDFDVIADFQSRMETPEDLREKAAEIGADAVIVTLLGGLYRKSDEWAHQDTAGSYTRIIGTAIKFKKWQKK